MDYEQETGVSLSDQYSEFICRLGGIDYASFIMGDAGEIEEVHVIAGKSHSPKQYVRDIQSAMLARYGVKVDHRVISIAQIDNKQIKNSSTFVRMICDEITCSRKNDFLEASLTLSYNDTVFEGSASAPGDEYAKIKMMSQATINAIHKMLNRDNVFSVVDVGKQTIAGKGSVLVCVSCRNEGLTELLLGSAFEKGDMDIAVVRATLCAINRRLALLL